MEKFLINVAEHIIDERLQGFEVSQKPTTSTVEYYGTNNKDTVFIQFSNGISYLYKNVKKEDIDAMHQTDSIGRYMATLANKGYEFIKISLQLVKSKTGENNCE